MKKLFFFSVLLMMTQMGLSQVGINTTTPNAQLDIRSSNQVTPSNTDGILIPKIDAFPLTNPTAAQQGMMVYLTTLSAGKPPGFYYWNNATATWLGLGGSSGWALTGNSGTNPATNFIGTTDPTDVVFRRDNVISGKIGMANTSFGRSSMNPLNSGIYNSAYGLSSMSSNTSGNSNSAFGNFALSSNTTGSFNTGMGSNTLYTNTTGQYNSAFGSDALEFNTTGNNNTATGYNSLYKNTLGNNNTANGYQALFENTTGGFNTALGSRTLYFNKTGAINTAVGDDALSKNDNGDFNVAMGGSSLLENVSGDNNTAIGLWALKDNIAGNQNTAVGANTLQVTTGSNNVALGYQSGISNATGSENTTLGTLSNVTLGNLTNATAIGARSQVGSSNSVVLGSINGVNGAAANASVSIGTTTPQAALDIAASDRGILIPRVALTSTTQVLPIVNPQGGSLVTSTMVYNTATTGDVTPGFYYWQGTSWYRFDVNGEGKPKYYTVLGTTDVTMSGISSTPIPEMTQTLTPNSTVVFAQFGISGHNAANACSERAIYFTLLVNGIPIKGFQTSMEDLFAVSRPIWGFSTTYPITVTPGVPVTISINWNADCGPIYNNVITPSPTGNLQAYRVLTIIDPNGGGGVVGSPPVATNLWALNGNLGTNPAANFIGTLDNNDLVFKRNGIITGRLASSNVSFGANSLFTNTTGTNNVAIGNLALNSNSTGSQATAVGSQAMFNSNNTTTPFLNQNVAVGFAALRGSGTPSSNTGNQNTGVGHSSLVNNSTGSYNTATGFQTLLGNTVGNYNSAFGWNALFNNSGSYNTGLGVNAMTNATSGGFNTVVGTNSLLNNTGSSNNTTLGYATLLNNITGSGNVAIGNEAGYNEAGSNKLYIENSNSSTPLIYGEFDTDLARINGNFRVKSTTVASAEMQIKNSNLYNHPADTNLNFGTGGGYFMVSTQDASASSETVGIRGDGDNVSIWSPGDGGRQLRILDEDNWNDNNGNPYDNGAEVAYIAANGQYFQVSDKNKKENIKKIEDASEKMNKISGYTYQYKLNPHEIEKGQKLVASSGVLAQEMESVLPEAVQKNESGEYFVDYAAITPLLIEAIKEQNAKIKLLETTNTEILKRLEKLENK